MNFREEIKAYLDGELSEPFAKKVEKALETDTNLQNELQLFRAFSSEIQAAAPEIPVVGKAQTIDILLEIEQKSKKRSPSRVIGWSVAGGFATCLLAAILFPLLAQPKEAAISVDRMAKSKEMLQQPAMSAPEADTSAKSRVYFEESTTNLHGLPTKSSIDMRDQVSSNLVIRTGSLIISVKQVSKAQQDVSNLVQRLGGFIENSELHSDAQSLPIVVVTFRIPSQHFNQVLEELRRYGEVKSESVSGEDVTAQVVDTEARLKVLRAEEDQYITLLAQTRKIGEILSVKERLSQVRQEIESLDAQRKSLRGRAQLSSVTVELKQLDEVGKPETADNFYEQVWIGAVNTLLAVWKGLASLAIFLFVLAPLWIPAMGLYLWWRKRSNP